MDWTPSEAMKVGDRITYVGAPPATWFDLLLWRLFRFQRKRPAVRREMVCTHVTHSD